MTSAAAFYSLFNFETDSQSHIFNCSVWPVVEKFRSKGHCAIYRASFYHYLSDQTENALVLAHSEGFQMGRPSRVDVSMVEKLRAKIIENWSVVTHSTKNIVMWILGMEKESSKCEAIAEVLCRNNIKLFLQKVGGK